MLGHATYSCPSRIKSVQLFWQDTAQDVTRYVHVRVRQGGTGHRGPVPFYGMLS